MLMAFAYSRHRGAGSLSLILLQKAKEFCPKKRVNPNALVVAVPAVSQ